MKIGWYLTEKNQGNVYNKLIYSFWQQETANHFAVGADANVITDANFNNQEMMRCRFDAGPSPSGMIKQCWFNVGPTSQTVAQH